METKTSAVQPLIDDHQAVLAKLQALENIFSNLDCKAEHASRLKELCAFFEKPFWLHFDKEEQALFPEFDNFMPRGAGPLEVMKEEHWVIRDINDTIQEAVALYLGEGDCAAIRQTINEKGMYFIEFLRAHIFKEDKLFPQLAEMHLGEVQISRVLRLFEQIENKTK